MNDEKTEGIVLKAVPFEENDRILSLFSPDQGIVTLYVRGLSKKKPTLVNLTTPLCRAEFLFRKGRSNLYRFIDGTILDLHLPLRRSYRHLEYAGKMLQAILKSQMPGKNAKKLYHLLSSYLKKLSEASFPETLWASFVLKLLKHEGLLVFDETCLRCEENAASHISEGESLCEKCAALRGQYQKVVNKEEFSKRKVQGVRCKKPQDRLSQQDNNKNFHSKGLRIDTLSLMPSKSFSFSVLDWKTLRVLSHVRVFDPLLKLELPSSLVQTIEALFSLYQIES
ncbi:MAG: DNA repair protein RecO [Simkaniaceae bacterium]|nr:DNA repair protein RecO [Simkaniaceae bacterium]